MKVTVYGQIGDGSLHPVGSVDADTMAEVKSELAAVLRAWASDADPEASFLEQVMLYDEEYRDDS